jgi:hypothetical protein
VKDNTRFSKRVAAVMLPDAAAGRCWSGAGVSTATSLVV